MATTAAPRTFTIEYANVDVPIPLDAVPLRHFLSFRTQESNGLHPSIFRCGGTVEYLVL